jgi:hypothetical protein
MDPIFSAGFNMPAPKGMFGGGGDKWKQALLAAAAGFMSRRSPQVAGNLIGGLMDAEQLKQRQALAEQQYQRERTDKRDDFIFEQDYRAQHQEPDEFTQLMQRAQIDPASEQGQALYLQFLQNKANPFTQMRVQNPDGSESLQFMRPPMAPTAPVGNLRPLGAGGAGAQPPRNFLGY